MTEPREYTADEVQELFLKSIWHLVHYWSDEKFNKYEALEGLASSILSQLDGGNIVMPGFKVIPDPHEDDKDYCISKGENWFPYYNFRDSEQADIGGSLHELFYKERERIND